MDAMLKLKTQPKKKNSRCAMIVFAQNGVEEY